MCYEIGIFLWIYYFVYANHSMFYSCRRYTRTQIPGDLVQHGSLVPPPLVWNQDSTKYVIDHSVYLKTPSIHLHAHNPSSAVAFYIIPAVHSVFSLTSCFVQPGAIGVDRVRWLYKQSWSCWMSQYSIVLFTLRSRVLPWTTIRLEF